MGRSPQEIEIENRVPDGMLETSSNIFSRPGVTNPPKREGSNFKEKIRRKKNRTLATVATLASFAPAAVLAGAVSGCGATGEVPISILGYPVPSQFQEPLAAAGQICPEYSSKDATAQALAESSIGKNVGPVKGSDGKYYMGPAMLNPDSDLFKKYSNGIGIYSPRSVEIMAKIVCMYIPQFGGSLVKALDAYNAGPNNIAGAGNYGTTIVDNADTVQLGKPQEQSQTPISTKGELPDVTKLSEQLIFPNPHSITFWEKDNPVVSFDKTGPNTWTAEGMGFSVVNGTPGKDPAGQEVLLTVNSKSEIATLTVTG